MSTRIGIPRALLFYKYFPAWKAFFEELGVEVVVSGETTKTTLDLGVRATVDEACLPVKLLIGHLAELKEQNVDFLLVPRVVSVERKRYLCPKFLGLPEMVRNSLEDLPELIDIEINVHKRYRETRRNLARLAARLSGRPFALSRAMQAAKKAQAAYEASLRRGLAPIDLLFPPGGDQEQGEKKIRIGLIGHVYNVNDPFISMNMIERLRSLGAEVVTPEMLAPEDICRGAAKFTKDIFWTFGKEQLGAARHLLEEKSIDGLVLVASFGCGPDSLTCEMVERLYKRESDVPVLLLTLDEHTGEAGIVTRLEAFTDMLRWRKAV